jgi:hypothetical protein
MTSKDDLHRVAAETEERARAERAAEQAEAERLAAEERAALDAVPIDDEVDADPEVVEVEERIAAGDESVSAEHLAEARNVAAGRIRFARLRQLAADRKARRDAEQLAREQAAAAEVHAREALAPYAPAALVEKYDAAVAGLRAYAEAVEERNAELRRLVRLPQAERHVGAVSDQRDAFGDRLAVDGHEYRRQQLDQHLRRVLEAAGVSAHNFQVIDRTRFRIDDRDPEIVAEGREQLAAAKGRKRGA